MSTNGIEEEVTLGQMFTNLVRARKRVVPLSVEESEKIVNALKYMFDGVDGKDAEHAANLKLAKELEVRVEFAPFTTEPWREVRR